MADYSFPTSYGVGTATIANGSLTVSGQGTYWRSDDPKLSPLRAGDLFGTHVGRPVRIEDVVSDTELLLAHAWPGDSQTTAPYEIQLTPRIVGAQEATRRLLASLSNGNLESFAEIPIDLNDILIGVGAGVLGTIKKEDLVKGDVVGPSGGTTVKQVAGFADDTGKLILGLTAPEIRAAADVYSKAEALPSAGGSMTGPITANYSGFFWNQRSGTQLTIAAGASMPFAAGAGLVVISENVSQGGTALFLIGQTQSVKIADSSNQYTATLNTSGKINIGYTGGSYFVQNATAAAIGIFIFSTRTRATAA